MSPRQNPFAAPVLGDYDPEVGFPRTHTYSHLAEDTRSDEQRRKDAMKFRDYMNKKDYKIVYSTPGSSVYAKGPGPWLSARDF